MNMAQACCIVMKIESGNYGKEAKFEACKLVASVIPNHNSVLKKSDYYNALKWLCNNTELLEVTDERTKI